MATRFNTETSDLRIGVSTIVIDSFDTQLNKMCLHKSNLTLPANSSRITYEASGIRSNHQVTNLSIATPSVILSDISWETRSEQVIFNYALASDQSTTISFDLIFCNNM